MKVRRPRPVIATDLRRRAEDLLSKTRREVAEMPAENLQKLGHELQVSHIELEMQNDELRRAQGKLEAARNQFAELYDFAPIGYVTLDTEGAIHEANLTAARLLGVNRENLLQQKLTRFLTPESQDVFYLHRQQVAATRIKQNCELQFRRKDGSTFCGSMESVAAQGGRRSRRQWLVAFADRSSPKKAEDTLREVSQFYQQIIAGTQEGIIVYGPDLRYRLWNPAMERMSGLPATGVLGKHPMEIFPFLREAGVLDQVKRALAGEPCSPVDFHFQIPESGRSGWALDTVAPLRNARGEIIGAIGIIHDITQRKREEDALRLSESNLTHFFESAPIGLQWLSASGTILRANRAQLDLVGYPLGECLGHHFAEFHTDPALATKLLGRLAKKETVTNFRSQLRRKDGSLRDVLIDANSSWDENRFIRSSAFTRDITRRVAREREILAVSEREQRRIAQDLHDGLGQILSGTFYLTSDLRQTLAAKSLPEARPLGRIVRLLDEAITQTRSLARGLHPVKDEANGLMVALKELASRTKTIFMVRCRFNCSRPVLIENATIATHLYRIAQEAVTNAAKHGRPDRIVIGLNETDDRVNLLVRDNGTGISERRLRDGMGLRIMRHRAGAIGASLVVQKHPQGGTSVVCSVQKRAINSRSDLAVPPPEKALKD